MVKGRTYRQSYLLNNPTSYSFLNILTLFISFLTRVLLGIAIGLKPTGIQPVMGGGAVQARRLYFAHGFDFAGRHAGIEIGLL